MILIFWADQGLFGQNGVFGQSHVTGWVRAGAKWLPWLVEPPVPQPRIVPVEFPEWREFDAFLKDIWSDPAAWRTRFQEEDPAEGWEGYDKIAAMGPREFASWYSAAYPDGYRISREQAESVPKAEFKEWKWGIVDETERFLGRRPVPPEAELPRFVADREGRATPLGQALMDGAIPTRCAATGRPLVQWRGCLLPVVAATDLREAELVAAEREGRPAPPTARCPSLTRRPLP